MTHRWVLVATVLGSSMVFIDGTVVNIALPVVQADLHATSSDLQWIVVGYTLFLSSLMLVGGSLGDHYGRKRMFLAGVAAFALASIVCGLAPDPRTLVAARCFQGVGSALLTPGSLAIIGATFAERERGAAIGTWSSVTAAWAAIGPALGGWLAEHASWRWIFYINVPIALAVIVISLRFVPESSDGERAHHIDWSGALVGTAGLGGIVYGLIFGTPAWSLAGAAALVAFGVIESRARSPLVPLELFRSKTFAGVNALTFLLYGALSGALFFLPFEMIQIDGYSPTAAGLAILPAIVLISTLSRTAGALVPVLGPRTLLVAGPLAAGLGFALLGAGAGHTAFLTAYLPGIAIFGLGMATTVAPLTTAVMGSVASNRMGVASGVNNAISRVASMVAIAVLSGVLLAAFSRGLDDRLSELRVSPAVHAAVMAHRTALAQTAAEAHVDQRTRAEIRPAVSEAYLEAFRLSLYICAGLAAAGAAVAALTCDAVINSSEAASARRSMP